jgi:hypothetical protein
VKRTVLPKAPWQDLAADLLGSMPGGEYPFVVVDYSITVAILMLTF